MVRRDAEPPVEIDPRTGGSPTRPGPTIRCSTRCGWRTWPPVGVPGRGRLGRVGPDSARKAAMAVELMLDAVAPTNFLPTNPAALKRAFDTGGASLVKGPAVPRRPGQQRGPAAPGRHQRVRGGPQPGLHPGQGRLPQRADGAHPVRAADRAGARHAAAVQPAVDQQVLRDGPGARAQLHRVGGAARADRVRDQLPQPVGRDVRHHDGRLPGARPEDRAGRDRGDHRRRDHRHRRAVPGRCAHRDHRGLPDPGRRLPDRHPDPAQHHARLRRAGRAGRLHRPGDGGEAREEDAPRRAPWPASRWPAPSTSCGPTT